MKQLPGFQSWFKGFWPKPNTWTSSMWWQYLSHRLCNLCDASKQILKQCPYNKGAVIWYDNCLLRYLNEEFFGQLDLLINFYHMCNKDNYPSQPMMFNPKTSNFMSQLAKEAVVNQKMYANRKAKLDGLNIFYGLAQCTRDLSSLFCETCLNNTIKALSYNCYGRQGGRVHTGNCNVRYEITILSVLRYCNMMGFGIKD